MTNPTLPNGHFYYFLRLPGPFGLGHMGWGFETAVELRTCSPEPASIVPSHPVMSAGPTYTRQFYFGSMENTGGDPVVLGNGNDYWTSVVDMEAHMLEEMRTMNLAASYLGKCVPGYTYYKKIPVPNADPIAAEAIAHSWSGYVVVVNNCLDNAAKVGEKYGVTVWSGARLIVASPKAYFNRVLHEYPAIPLSPDTSVAATPVPGE